MKPTDYSIDDGFHEGKGCEVCPHCEKVYTANGGYLDTVVDQSGREYDNYMETEPGEGPFFCADCWTDLEANQNASENKQLGEFA